MRQLLPGDLKQWLDDVERENPMLLDVRESWEFQYCHIAGSTLLPLGLLAGQLSDFESDREIVVICHHGIRSYRAGLLLEHAGVSNAYNLQGGVEAWARDIDPSMRRY